MAASCDTQLCMCCLILVAGILVSGCGENAESRLPESEEWDFGDVQIDNGAITVTHDFTLANTTSGHLEIVELVPSCGCVGVEVSEMHLAAGEASTVTVGLKLVEPGPQQHSLGILLSDGNWKRFQVSGNGVRRSELRAVLTDYSQASFIKGQLMLMYESGHGDHATPVLLDPLDSGLSFEAAPWTTVTEADEQGGRPGRQICEFSLYRDASLARPMRIRIGVGSQEVDLVWP